VGTSDALLELPPIVIKEKIGFFAALLSALLSSPAYAFEISANARRLPAAPAF
jgi:hypothetical protein